MQKNNDKRCYHFFMVLWYIQKEWDEIMGPMIHGITDIPNAIIEYMKNNISYSFTFVLSSIKFKHELVHFSLLGHIHILKKIKNQLKMLVLKENK